MRETRNLLNLHWLFCLRITAKSWTTFCRDRIAPTCTIRHPVCPIVALQRRMRFSARLAGFRRGRWHQRRARRAELASFSGLVSNLDFRVPRLRPNRRTGADRAVRQRKRGHPRGPESRPGLSRRSRPSTFWSRCSPGLLDVHLSPGMDRTTKGRAACSSLADLWKGDDFTLAGWLEQGETLDNLFEATDESGFGGHNRITRRGPDSDGARSRRF